MAMTPLELVKAARKAIGEDMPDDICPDDLWGPVKSSSSREKSSPVTVSPSSSASLPGDVATVGTVASTTTSTTATTTATATSSGKSVSIYNDILGWYVYLILLIPCKYISTNIDLCTAFSQTKLLHRFIYFIKVTIVILR